MNDEFVKWFFGFLIILTMWLAVPLTCYITGEPTVATLGILAAVGTVLTLMVLDD